MGLRFSDVQELPEAAVVQAQEIARVLMIARFVRLSCEARRLRLVLDTAAALAQQSSHRPPSQPR